MVRKVKESSSQIELELIDERKPNEPQDQNWKTNIRWAYLFALLLDGQADVFFFLWFKDSNECNLKPGYRYDLKFLFACFICL